MATASDRFLKSESTSQSGPREALFVDRRAPDFHELIEGARPGMRVVVLDPRRDALTQIADTLERECCDMVHIVAHGAPGAIAFSSGSLSAATLRDHASALARIGAALDADAEILLWSCEVGLGAVGTKFLDVLSDLTGAYVAGATHNIGAGAPWTLDAARRPLAAEVPFTAKTIATYQGTLATRLWYATHGEDATDAGLDRINANGTNQQIPAVDDTTHGLGSAWQEVVIDQANNLYFILEYDLTGQTATLYQGSLNSAAAPTARHTFDAADIDIVRGLEIDTVNNRLYVGQLDFDNDTDFNIVAASTGILQMDYNTTTGVVTNTNNFLVTQASDPLADGYYVPNDFALGDGSLFFIQEAQAGNNQLYRVDLTTQNVNAVLKQTQFPTDFSNGHLSDVEIDTSNDLLYFTTHDDPTSPPGSAALNKIWYISTSATGTLDATQLTLTGFSDANFFPGDLTFDAVARRLYVESEGTSDGGGNGAGDDVIYVFQLNAAGISASLVSTFTVGFATESVSNIGGMAITQNVAPTLAGLNSATFLENTVNASPQLVDTAVVFDDTDDLNLNGGNLTVTYTGAPLAQDNLSVRNIGNGAGQIGVSGTTVSFGGVAIGTITTNGAAGANLVISLNASATPTAIDALIQALQYQNTSNAPTATRTISITINDGQGGTSTAATSLITVTAENDAPTGITGGPFSVAEFGVGGSANGTPVGTVTAQDPDGSSGFTYSFAVGGDAGGRFTIDPSSGQISVLDGTLLDFEQNTSHNVTVHVVDSGGLSPAADTVFAIGVTDVNPEDVTGNGNPNTFHGGPGDDTLRGLAGVDTLVGNGGKDILNGGTGGDSMQGGLGDDVYFADDPADAANENVAEGADRVFASVSYTLTAGSEIEILTTTDHAGSGAINLTGNGFANFIYGNTGVNTLDGAGGSDVLVGNNGDTLIGGQGDDTLISAPGVDTMNGGTDNDQYFVDEAADIVNEVINEGSDRVWAAVSYALAAGSEIETLTTTFHFGTAAINLTGNEFTNFILGNDGDNVINGGAGADTVVGRAGNDQFFVDDASDVVLESVGGGSDRVFATVNYTLTAGSEVEILTTNNHLGLAPINLTGNEFANFINGNAGINTLDGGGGADVLIGNGGDTLIGGEGDDTLIGGAGVDTMTGGNGNDQFFVDAAGDVVNESAGQGNDRVWTSVSYTLAAASEIETFTTTNQLGVDLINLTGNEFGQFVAGNDGNNVIDGDGGNDTLTGRAGDDDFVYAATSDSNETSGLDRITDFSGTDQLSFAALGLTTDKSAIINKGTAAYVSSSADFFDNGGTDFAVAVQTNGDTTRVYADSNGDGNYTVGSDLAIEFSGNILANLNSTSDYIFV